MSMAGEIRRAARQVYADGQAHENAEVRDELARRGFPVPSDSAALRSVLHQMKERGEIELVRPGVYRLTAVTEGDETASSLPFSLEELAAQKQRLERTIQEIKAFDWLRCSDAELQRAREKAALLRQMADLLRRSDL
ncbi:hypothetical protein [Bittarella massiliensis (ex Durand et al. 2017)]|uniref:hypothetical protein n=1 Tax=Bittarella massiliensis (ex Durand et al. 2017) TaxID=1720313 RepID=UPI001AA0F12A|nr:hypothetical protein [Bittarella massiliensis (ex Durand et al. 2017)]MBO1679067.1 hypothetical protein [Bittarella massiliensis (ex Durand et al. 2017)]